MKPEERSALASKWIIRHHSGLYADYLNSMPYTDDIMQAYQFASYEEADENIKIEGLSDYEVPVRYLDELDSLVGLESSLIYNPIQPEPSAPLEYEFAAEESETPLKSDGFIEGGVKHPQKIPVYLSAYEWHSLLVTLEYELRVVNRDQPVTKQLLNAIGTQLNTGSEVSYE